MPKYNAKESLLEHGIIVGKKVASTLQGSIYTGILKDTNETVIIKRTNKILHKLQTTRVIESECYRVHENIIREVKLVLFLQKLKPVDGILKIHKFIDDDRNYFVIMEHGGKSLFKHVKQYRQMVNNHAWENHIKQIYRQILSIINWLHKNKVCHLDISLENFTLKGFKYDNKSGKIINNGKVYLIDFGLSEYFGNNSTFICNKKCGKYTYQSPEVFSGGNYNAKKADIWSLGVVLFALILGIHPYITPTINDAFYCGIMKGDLDKILITHNKAKYINNFSSFVNLLNNIFCKQTKRYSIDDIINHSYMAQLL